MSRIIPNSIDNVKIKPIKKQIQDLKIKKQNKSLHMKTSFRKAYNKAIDKLNSSTESQTHTDRYSSININDSINTSLRQNQNHRYSYLNPNSVLQGHSILKDTSLLKTERIKQNSQDLINLNVKKEIESSGLYKSKTKFEQEMEAMKIINPLKAPPQVVYQNLKQSTKVFSFQPPTIKPPRASPRPLGLHRHSKSLPQLKPLLPSPKAETPHWEKVTTIKSIKPLRLKLPKDNLPQPKVLPRPMPERGCAPEDCSLRSEGEKKEVKLPSVKKRWILDGFMIMNRFEFDTPEEATVVKIIGDNFKTTDDKADLLKSGIRQANVICSLVFNDVFVDDMKFFINLIHLDLKGNHQVPMHKLVDLIHLKHLDLSFNKLKKISIKNGFKFLEVLNLGFNKLSQKSLKEITSLAKNLKKLNLEANELTDLPTQFIKFQKLKDLNLANNLLKNSIESVLCLEDSKRDFEESNFTLFDILSKIWPLKHLNVSNNALKGIFINDYTT
ncbi:unnamed protein product [Moneuplotes crassus]|uniref:Uncharacterized protein n=1 Tax=Euplotes crassus TaxID=5936 RepID=A0AAD1XSS0_EUPCR|nr:unnamed protein product [Moneuplotes crassus]